MKLGEWVQRRILRRGTVRLLVLGRRLGVVGSAAVGPESARPPHLAASEGGWRVVAADRARFRGCSGCTECRMLV